MKESAFLRFLDLYVGTFLCFVLSLFRRIRPYNPNIRRILLIELFEMGASVMAIPSVRHILSRHPNAEIYVLTTIGNRSSWYISQLIDKDRIVCLDGRNLWTFIRSGIWAIFHLRALRIDLAVDFEKFSRISVTFSVLSRVRRVAGFFRYEYEGLYRGTNLIDAPCAFNQNSHIAFNFLALTKTALSTSLSYPNLKEALNPSELSIPRITVEAERIVHVHNQLGLSESETLVTMCPDVGGNLQIRNYPVESYARVAQSLLEDSATRHIAIIGLNSNRVICDQLEGLISNPRVHNLCGSTPSLEGLIELISASELLIGNDNGPLHFASLTSTPILGIFSTDSPFMYGPLGEAVVLFTFYHCSPCISALNHKRSRCRESDCISSIHPSIVSDMAKRLIHKEVETRTINRTISYLSSGEALFEQQPLVYIGSSRKKPSSKHPSSEQEFATLC